MKVEKIPFYTLLIGLFLYLIQIIIPIPDIGGLNYTGFLTLYILPLLGVIGVVTSIIKKRWLLLFLNILMIFSFYILMGIGYLVYSLI